MRTMVGPPTHRDTAGKRRLPRRRPPHRRKLRAARRAFHGRPGYREVGVHGRAVALDDGTYRDEIMMIVDL